MKRIFCDLHDVVYPYVSVLINELGWSTTLEGRLKDFWPDHDWDTHFEDGHHAAFLDRLPLMPGVAGALWSIAYTGVYDVFFLTATHPNTPSEDVVRRQIRNSSLPPFPVFFVDGPKAKVNWILDQSDSENIIVIDDSHIVLEGVSGLVGQTIIWDTPWNRHISVTNANQYPTTRRVSTWKDLCRLLVIPQELPQVASPM